MGIMERTQGVFMPQASALDAMPVGGHSHSTVKKKRATDKNLKLASSNAAFLVQHGRGLV